MAYNGTFAKLVWSATPLTLRPSSLSESLDKPPNDACRNERFVIFNEELT